MDDHSRRTFVRTTGLAGAALALETGSAAGYEGGAIDSALETTGDLTQEGILVVREREGRAVVTRLSAQARAALESETEATATAEASGIVASD